MPAPLSLESRLGGSGKTFSVRARDGSGNLSNFTALNTDSSELIHIHAASGTWTATLNGNTTSAIAVGALAADVEDALEALSGVGEGQCVVTGDGPTRLVDWTGALAGTVVPLLTFGTGSLSATGSAPATTAGSTAEHVTDATLGATFATLGTWIGSAASRVATAAGDGRLQAQWTIAGLAAGLYQVFVGLATSGAGNAPNVPYRFFDGTTPRGLVLFNQQSIPNLISFGDGGATNFQAVATVAITTGHSLRALLTDEGVATGKQLEAAKIAVVPIDLVTGQILTSPLNPTYVSQAIPGNWRFNASNVGAWNGTHDYTQLPNQTYTWTFPGVLPGTYSVQVQYPVASNADTAASYQVFCDGVASGAPVVVNQTVAIGTGGGNLTRTDSQPASLNFKNLGSGFVTTTGNITVVVTSSAGTGSGGIFGCFTDACLISLQSASAYTEAVSATGEQFAGGPPTIKVNGGAPIVLTNPNFDPGVAGVGVSPVMMFPLATPILSTDAVTFTAPANCFATAAGSIPAITNQAVANHVGGSVGPATPGIRTLKVGYNLLPSGIVPISSNLFLNQQPLAFTDSLPGTSLGYPRSATAANFSFSFGIEPANAVDAKGYPGLLQGLYKCNYDGATGGQIAVTPTTGTTIAFVSLNTGHATGNSVQWNATIADSTTYYAPSFVLNLNINQGFADDADTGRCSSVGVWTSGSAATSWNGGYHLSDTSPSSVWTWTLGSLPGGTYTFASHWKGRVGNTTQARYTVKQAGIELIHWDVDQTADPALFATMQGSDLNGNQFYFRPESQSALTTGGLITIELHTVNGDGQAMADAVGYHLTGSLTSGTPFAPFANAALLGPETSSLSVVPEFNPLSTAALGNAQVIRAMRMQSAIFGAFSEISDYAQEGQLTYQGNPARPNRYNILKVENDPHADTFWLRTPLPRPTPDLGPWDGSVLVTLSAINGAPLPIKDRTPFLFPTMSDPTYSISGGVFNLSLYENIAHYNPATMATNQISVGRHLAANYGLGSDTLTTMNLSAGTAIGTQDFTSIPRVVYYRRVASIPGCAAWINPTLTWSDAAIAAECAIYKATMPVGSQLIWEPDNETWNFNFPGFWSCDSYARVNGLANFTIGYAAIAAHQHAVATTALGSRSGELVRAFGCTTVDSTTYTSLLSYCASISAPVDLILISDYVSIVPQQVGGVDYSVYDAAMLVDCTDATIQLAGQVAAGFAAVQAACVAASTGGHTVRWGIYEAQTFTSIGGTTLQQQKQAYGAVLHPLQYQAKLANFALAQQNGATVMAIYSFDEQAFDEFPNANYGVFHAVNPTNGIGDGSDGLHDNRPDIVGTPPAVPDLRTAVYPMGAAVQAWNGGGGTLSNPYVFFILIGVPMPINVTLGRTYRLGIFNDSNFDIPANVFAASLAGMTAALSFSAAPVTLVAANDGSGISGGIPKRTWAFSNAIDNSTANNIGGDIGVTCDLKSNPGSNTGTLRFQIQTSGDNGVSWPDSGTEGNLPELGMSFSQGNKNGRSSKV